MRARNSSLYLAASGILFPALVLVAMFALLRMDTIQAASNGTTTRVSVASNGTQANYNSFEADISVDGRYVAFASGANNLVGGDSNEVWDVFVRDRLTNQTGRVSVASDGGQGWYGPTRSPQTSQPMGAM